MTTSAERVQESDIRRGGARRSRTGQFLIVAVMLMGAVLRISRWSHFRCLWLDEIYLARSVVSRSLHDLLFRPLEDWQAAPAGFLSLVHVFARIFGSGERSLRLVSILFGLASLPLMLGVARRVLGTGGVFVAMAAFSFLGPLIYYSNELKPYICDVVVSLSITLTVIDWSEDRGRRRAIVAAMMGAIGVFFSFPAVFVLAGAGLWMLAGRRESRSVLIVCAVWMLAFAADYFIFLRPFTAGEAHPHLVHYWVGENAFMPHRPIEMVKWIFWDLDAIASNPGGMWLDYPDAALIGLIVGAAVAVRGRGKLLLLLAPLPLAMIASATKQYPLGDRLALFFVPQYLLLMAAGVESLWTSFSGKVAAVAIAGCIIVPSAQRATTYLFYVPGREESLPAYRWAAQHYQAGDAVFLTQFAEPSFHYYEREADWPVDLEAAGKLIVQGENLGTSQIIDDAKRLAGRGRVWVILVHAEGGEFSAATATRTAFDQIGRAVMSHEEPGAAVVLYECIGKSEIRNQNGESNSKPD